MYSNKHGAGPGARRKASRATGWPRGSTGRPQAGLSGVLADALAPGDNREGKRILVIDDEPSMTKAVRLLLEAVGCVVEVAEDGPAGLALAAKRPPDLVLCDMYLPRGDGLAVLKQLRDQSATTALPFILMTGQDDGAVMRRGMALGADDFLVKPFSNGTLLAAVEARFRRLEDQEQAARRVKERLVEVIEASADWALMVELADQAITYCNSAAVSTLEMDVARTGRRGHLADWMPPEALRCFNQDVLPQALRQGWWLGETVFRTRTGREVPVRLQVRVPRAEGASLEYVSLVAHDLSESRQAQQKLRESERQLRSILETAMDGFWEADLQGCLLKVNQTYCRMSGYPASELLKMHICELEATAPAATTAAHIEKVMTQGEVRFETQHRRKDGGVFEVEISIQFQPAAGGRLVAFLRDITARKQMEHRERVTRELLELLNRSAVAEEDTIRTILVALRQHTGLEAVGIRLRDGLDFPYYTAQGFPESFLAQERFLCARDTAGEIVRDGEGNPVLECMCGNILCGRTNPALPFFTEGGSFWSNSTTRLLATTTEADRQAHTRNRCHGEGYESVALIPLRVGEEIIGLLQLNDHRPNVFTPDMIRFVEGLGASIGIALRRKQAEASLVAERDLLEQRVLERTASLQEEINKRKRAVRALQTERNLLEGRVQE